MIETSGSIDAQCRRLLNDLGGTVTAAPVAEEQASTASGGDDDDDDDEIVAVDPTEADAAHQPGHHGGTAEEEAVEGAEEWSRVFSRLDAATLLPCSHRSTRTVGNWRQHKDAVFLAADADHDANECDTLGRCPPPPPRTATGEQVPVSACLNDEAKATRSAATLFLAWVRLELEGRAARCRITGLPLRFSQATCARFHPLRSSRAAHLVHRLPIHYGWASALPTSLADFDPAKVNVSVESWFGNKWLQSWRLRGLSATLARRPDWYLTHAKSNGARAAVARGDRAGENSR
ncbi:unnamed protein product [Parajaminaea phylloscopi]